MSSAEQLDRLFQALADPYRRGFIERLAKGPASVTELAGAATVQLPAVLKHLRVLEEGGIVVSEKIGRIRIFRMRPDAFRDMNGWIDQRQRDMHLAFGQLAIAMAEIPEEKDH
jgi:DNA-binding transcriptional ArsR family regulator